MYIFLISATCMRRLNAVGRSLIDNAALAVSLRIHTQDRATVFEQHRGRMPEILAVFMIDNDLSIELIVEVEEGNRIWPIASHRDAWQKWQNHQQNYDGTERCHSSGNES